MKFGKKYFILFLLCALIINTNTYEPSTMDNLITHAPSIVKNCYQKVSECTFLYNPLGIAAISLTSAIVGFRRLGILAVGGIMALYSEQIIEYASNYPHALTENVKIADDKVVEPNK